jgi:hypothetical protein
LRALHVGDPSGVLLNNGALVQVRRDIMRRRADQAYAFLVRLLVRFRPFETCRYSARLLFRATAYRPSRRNGNI